MEFVESSKIKGLFLIKPSVFGDNRGNFFESYSEKVFNENSINAKFLQDNQSFSSEIGTLRGMHLQSGDSSQAKLVRAVSGKIFDVVVDMRPNSPSFGVWQGFELSEENNHMIFIPKNFLHGFMTLTPNVIFFYKCDNYYDKSSEAGVIWNDPTINIHWPLDVTPVLSEKDKILPTFKEYKDSLEIRN